MTRNAQRHHCSHQQRCSIETRADQGAHACNIDMCHRDVDEPLEYLVERHVAGIKTHLNEQFFDRKILRRAFESTMHYGSQI